MSELILVAHPVHDSIPEDAMRAAVDPRATVRGVVEIKPRGLTLEETRHPDWIELARTQAAQWRASAVPLLKKYPTAEIAYFGLAPIPLAMHLGTLAGRWKQIKVFLRHHKSREWRYEGGALPALIGPDGPHESVRSADPAILTVSTTAPADRGALRDILGATSAEIDVRTETLGEDVLSSELAVVAVGDRVLKALELLESNRPGVAEVHFLGAIPVGLAFLIGTHITPTRHATFVTYQYFRSAEPRLVEALRLPVRERSAVPVSAADRTSAAELRAAWEKERSDVTSFVSRMPRDAPWWSILGDIGRPFAAGHFAKLETAHTSPITSPIDVSETNVEGGFRYEPSTRKWLLGDELLRSTRALVSESRLARAGRMLLLHEALHHGRQGLTAATAPRIRHAPKVLEELDYAADIWAMMHEFAYSGLCAAGWNDQREGLLGILATALDTMWAFDVDAEPGVLEVRRVNRYLIWYANLARLEAADDINQAIAVLADKPVIDLIGPQHELRDGRLVALLDRPGRVTPELCLLDPLGRLKRFGDTNASGPSGIAHALGAHAGSTVRELMRGFVL